MDMLCRKRFMSQGRSLFAPTFLIFILILIFLLHPHRLLLIIKIFATIARDINDGMPG